MSWLSHAYIEDRARRMQLRDAYSRYREEQAAAYVVAMDPSDRERALATTIQELRSRFTSLFWTSQTLRSVAEASLRAELAASLPLLDLGTFVDQISGAEEGYSSEERHAR